MFQSAQFGHSRASRVQRAGVNARPSPGTDTGAVPGWVERIRPKGTEGRAGYTQPVGFGRPAILQAPLPGPEGNSS